MIERKVPSKLNGLMSGIERSFNDHDKKFDRLELAIIGLYILNVSIVAASIFLGVFE
tara:strand:+ start:458 stop:628 length:171 start_codon:yes stop_codon:yes gene_type:complete